MEWLVPVLFVLVSLAQWWMKHRQTVAPTLPPNAKNQETPPRTDPLDEFGDLLEALGRRRHESPPPLPTMTKAAPPRILPPLEEVIPTMASVLAAPSLPAPSPTLILSRPKRVPKDQISPIDPYAFKSLFRVSSTDWRKAFILSEILAPPVGLR